MKNWSKVLSLFIVFAMVMSFPIAGFAEDDDMDDEWEAEERMIDDDDDDDDKREANLKRLLSRDRILSIVKGLADGKIMKMKLDEDDDRYIYKIEVKSKNAEYEFEIDAITGDVLEMDIDEKEADEEDMLLPDVISEGEVMRIALEAFKGTIIEIEADDLDKEDGKYEVTILLDGVEYELEINAFTGEIIEIDQEEIDIDDKDEEDDEEEDDDKDAPAWGHIKNDLQLQRKVLKEKMKSLREQMEILEESIEDAEEIDDIETLGQLNEQVKNFQSELEMQKLMSKQMIKDMQQLMKDKYSAEEWQTLEMNKEEMKDMPGVRVMPAESILMPEGNLKFDVPPVIKNSRMLVPIRAISEALDADVSWDNDTRTATIVTDEHTIVIAISDETVLVNGEPIETDVPAEIIKGRIVVPLRFIIENMGLDIEWDQETETAEIL